MDTLQCAVLLAKLERFDWEIEQRQNAASRYSDLLAEARAIDLPQVKSDRTSVWAQYTLRVQDRERLQRSLQQRGIPTAVHYPIPLYRQAAYAQDLSLPVTERAAREVMSLPMHADLTVEMQREIATALSDNT